MYVRNSRFLNATIKALQRQQQYAMTLHKNFISQLPPTIHYTYVILANGTITLARSIDTLFLMWFILIGG
jgi:hypothetical protein